MDVHSWQLNLQEYLKILVSDNWRIPHQDLNESWAFIANVNTVNLLFLLKLRE